MTPVRYWVDHTDRNTNHTFGNASGWFVGMTYLGADGGIALFVSKPLAELFCELMQNAANPPPTG